MKEDDILKTLETVNKCYEDIENYITSTEDCLLYWFSNRDVSDFIKAYPDNYNELYTINVLYVIGNSALVRITFDEHPDEQLDCVERYCNLPRFREVVRDKIAEFNGEMEALKKKKIEETIQYHKGKIKELEEELKEFEV